MAYLDAQLVLSNAQADTEVSAHDSTNKLDLGAVRDYVGQGQDLVLNVVVNTTFTSGGAATLAVAVLSCATVDGSYTTHVSTPALALAGLTAGTILLQITLPPDIERYLKLTYTIGTAVMTAGAIDAWIGTVGPSLQTRRISS